MSEFVVRMEMPSKGKLCGTVFDFCGVWYCPVKKRICSQPDNGDIPSWCPIICQLPEGHGRLVDANAYAEELWDFRRNYQLMDDTHTADKIMRGLYRAEQALKDAPTIVPAERKDNGKTC